MFEQNSHNVRKASTMGAILVIALLLLTAGTVYAVTQLTSQTTIDQNEIEYQDILISVQTPGSPSVDKFSDFLDDVGFDTVVKQAGTEYNVHPTATRVVDGESVPIAQISKPTTVTVSKTASVDSTTYTLTITPTVGKFTELDGISYTMYVAGAPTEYAEYDSVVNAWTFNGLTIGTTYNVVLYVSGSLGTLTSAPTGIGFVSYDAQSEEDGCEFVFLATLE